eukprot:TRINITY_DN11285_c1_g2_i3.p1 TRINITY_DN11285_c1_g2~~TRINITY_DN11285_c1_g2_i3.p1  ORF type:complete len:771 (+),score=157.38 TRINITY_DN11285_c1_g2_i3:347-2314(+)
MEGLPPSSSYFRACSGLGAMSRIPQRGAHSWPRLPGQAWAGAPVPRDGGAGGLEQGFLETRAGDSPRLQVAGKREKGKRFQDCKKGERKEKAGGSSLAGSGTLEGTREGAGVGGALMTRVAQVEERSSWMFADPLERHPQEEVAVMDAVVKVYCTHTEPNFSLPWQKRRQHSSSGSGFVISGRHILTNAHCVEHHSQVKVQRRGDESKFAAKVLAIGPECDLALLTVADEEFWEASDAFLEFGGLPRLQDAVAVVGYPIGGDTISVTSGVVSRIEVTSYAHGSTELLGVQIDAAINSGNSGGPAFNTEGKCVGIAFQSLKSPDAENIGYIIPTPVVAHFLNDYSRNGRYTGFPALGIQWQRMESPALRASLGLRKGQKGVLIRQVEPTSPAFHILQPEDVLMRFDGEMVANDGTVSFRVGERISFGFLVSQKFSGDHAVLHILRKGKELEVSVELRTLIRLIPTHLSGRPPSYFIFAGLVFTTVVQPFLQSEYGADFEYDTPVKLLDKLLNGQAEFADQQVVVLSQVLAHDVNVGYEDVTNQQVLKVNGVLIRNLQHLAGLLDACDSSEYVSLSLDHSLLLVLDTAAARRSTAGLLHEHCIPADRSEELQSIGPGLPTEAASKGLSHEEGSNGVPQRGRIVDVEASKDIPEERIP